MTAGTHTPVAADKMIQAWLERMYSRTQNENGSFNTRCLYCFLTLAFSVATEEELERVEARHLCPEKVFAELAAQEKRVTL